MFAISLFFFGPPEFIGTPYVTNLIIIKWMYNIIGPQNIMIFKLHITNLILLEQHVLKSHYASVPVINNLF